MSRDLIITPYSRVEGDLRIHLSLEDKTVTEARASGVMFRGFEHILRGHHPEDAIVYTPRICGICCISHSVASSLALRAVSEDFSPSPAGEIATNIAHATENVMSHITQFYLYFLPDLLSNRFSSFSMYDEIRKRFTPFEGTSTLQAIRERKKFLEILGYLVGKWPHTLAIQPGGITKSIESSDIYHVQGILKDFTAYIESRLVGMPLRKYLEIDTEERLEESLLNERDTLSDMGLFYMAARELELLELGRGPGRFISGGAYPFQEDGHFFQPGYWDGELEPLDPGNISESITHSFFSDGNEFSSPFEDRSEPSPEKESAYSWAKAPRYRKQVVEVGAIGRQVVSAEPLITDLYGRYGSTVFTRVFARLHEAIILLAAMEEWVSRLDSCADYYVKNKLKDNARGTGITEAARGFLGHWIVVKEGKISNYQVITPTAFNCSPRDHRDRPGPVEQSVTGTVVASENDPVEVDIIIRSYDPCLVCTVH